MSGEPSQITGYCTICSTATPGLQQGNHHISTLLAIHHQWIPLTKTNNVESVSMSWHHHVTPLLTHLGYLCLAYVPRDIFHGAAARKG